MKRLKRLSSFGTASVLAVSALLNIAFVPVAHAAAETCTWIATSDSNFNNAANWSGCDGAGVPEAVDTIAFGSNGNTQILTNDLGHEVAGIIIGAPVGVGGTGYTIDTLTIANGGTITDNGEGGTAYINTTVTNLTAAGNVTLAGNGNGRLSVTNWTLNGVLTLSNGTYFYGDDVGSSGVVVQKGATLYFTAASASPSTGSFPITLGGGSGTADPILDFSGYNGQPTTWAFANPLTLLGNALVMLDTANVTVNQTGSISGPGFVLGLHTDSATGSKLIINPSSNNSATVAGTYTGTGAGSQTGGNGGGEDAAPAAPDTGFALATKNPAVTATLVLAAAVAIALIARRLQVAGVKSRR